MPTTLPQLIAQSVEVGVRRAIGRYMPGTPEKVGLAVGAMILTVGLAARARRARLERIERKLDTLAEHEQLAVA